MGPPSISRRRAWVFHTGDLSVTIPAFDINGVLPPFIGPKGPGDAAHLMTPYDATASEVVQRFSYSPGRISILKGWLEHRKALRALGLVIGFQFIDGSFVEDKDPRDIDVVTYSFDPSATSAADLLQKMHANPSVFKKADAKRDYHVDAHFVDLRGNIDNVIRGTCYWTGLFSHNRPDALWKGMLRVPLDTVADDDAAQAHLDSLTVAAPAIAPAPTPATV